MAKKGGRWFGTGGWRAIIGDTFVADNIRLLSQAVADDMKAKEQQEIVLGYDRRFLSDKAAEWAAEVFAANGITVFFINKFVPTPLVMFSVKERGTYYGMAITASHNPFDYNGIKIFIKGGRDADVEVTDVFEDIIAKGTFPKYTAFDKAVADGIIKLINPSNDYCDSILANLDIDRIKSQNMRVLLDPMYGVGKPTLNTILSVCRVEMDTIHDSHDAYFGGKYPAPAPERLTELKEKVIAGRYDLGIALDGDADRIAVFDEVGRYISANEILSLLYYYMLQYKGLRGDVVRNLATTHILDRIAEDFGQKCHEVPVGFKWISGKMDEADALIGGESSGGLTIKGHIKGKDSVFASAMLVEMLAGSGQRIAGLLNEIEFKYGKMETAEFDVKFSAQKKAELMALLFEEKKLPEYDIEVEKVNYLDGCKVYFKNGGWLIARFSGTEPLLRVFCEMSTLAEAKKYVDVTRKFLGL
ncbi:MAG: phosphoglucomutase/phosphomannomutase family protein [Oscillospiraceae bacterium]|nr:phosphoglucomutase/phosphomannomutase family protein [Oscillospiraceae bacterium]